MADDDLVDIVDESDRVLRTARRKAMRAQNLWHRTVSILCFNTRGQLYVQRRSATKDLFPGLYDMFTAGCLAAGETYAVAARRELVEELGVEGPALEPLFRTHYDGPQTRTQTWIYCTQWDGPIGHLDGEVAWGAFVDLQQVIENPAGWSYVPDGASHFAEVRRRNLLRPPRGR